jgi:hypothetical protein
MAFTPTKAQLIAWQKQGASQPAQAPSGFTPTRAQLIAWQKQGEQPSPTPPQRIGMGTSLADLMGPEASSMVKELAAPFAAAASGIGEGTREIGQLAATPLNYLVRKAGGPQNLIQLPKASLTHALGLPEDAPIEALGETVPALAGADVAAPFLGITAAAEAIPGLTEGILSQAAGGAAYSAGKADDQGRGIGEAAAIGAGLGAAGGAAGGLFGALGKPIGSYISRNIMEPLAQKGADLLATTSPQTSALSELGGQLRASRAIGKNWDADLSEAAAAADRESFRGMSHKQTQAALTQPWKELFDNRNYLKTGDTILRDLQKKESSDPEHYAPLIKAVKQKIDLAPRTYTEAIDQRVALNRMPKTWEKTNDAIANQLKGISGKMKAEIDTQLEKGTSANPAVQKLARVAKAHQQNWKFLKSFDQTPVARRGGKLVLKYHRPQAEAMQGDIPPEGTLKHFLPTSKDDDTLKMEHLGNLLGDRALARQALKEEYLSPAAEEGGEFNPGRLLNKFKKLSQKQRDYFFSPEEQTLFNSSLKAKGAGRKALLHHLMFRYGTPTGLGALAGGYLSEHEGGGFGTGAILGAGAGLGLQGLPRFFASPEGAAMAKRLTEEGFKSRAAAYPASVGLLSLLQN